MPEQIIVIRADTRDAQQDLRRIDTLLDRVGRSADTVNRRLRLDVRGQQAQQELQRVGQQYQSLANIARRTQQALRINVGAQAAVRDIQRVRREINALRRDATGLNRIFRFDASAAGLGVLDRIRTSLERIRRAQTGIRRQFSFTVTGNAAQRLQLIANRLRAIQNLGAAQRRSFQFNVTGNAIERIRRIQTALNQLRTATERIRENIRLNVSTTAVNQIRRITNALTNLQAVSDRIRRNLSFNVSTTAVNQIRRITNALTNLRNISNSIRQNLTFNVSTVAVNQIRRITNALTNLRAITASIRNNISFNIVSNAESRINRLRQALLRLDTVAQSIRNSVSFNVASGPALQRIARLRTSLQMLDTIAQSIRNNISFRVDTAAVNQIRRITNALVGLRNLARDFRENLTFNVSTTAVNQIRRISNALTQLQRITSSINRNLTFTVSGNFTQQLRRLRLALRAVTGLRVLDFQIQGNPTRRINNIAAAIERLNNQLLTAIARFGQLNAAQGAVRTPRRTPTGGPPGTGAVPLAIPLPRGAADEVDRLSRAGQNLDETTRRVGLLGQAMNRLAVSAGNVRGFLTSIALFGTGAGALQAVTSFGELEEIINRVQANTGATVQEMEMVREVLAQIGQDTRFTANEAAEGLRLLTQSGLSLNEAITALPSVLDLSIIGNTSLAESADIATNVMKTMGLEVTDLNRIMDVLANTSTSSNTTIRSLGQAFSYAGGLASSLGVPIEVVAGAIGVLGDAGLADRAGTGLVAVFRGLLNPANEAAEALESYGLNLNSIDVASRGLIPVIRDLADANISGADAIKLFGTEGLPAFLALAEGVDTLEDLSVANNNAAGTAREMVSVISRGFNEAIIQLTSSVDNFGKSLVEEWEAPLTRLLDGMRNMVNVMAENVQEIAALGAGLGALVTYAVVNRQMANLATAITSVSTAIQGMSTAGLASTLSGIVASFGTLSAILTALVAIPAVLVFLTAFRDTFQESRVPGVRNLGVALESLATSFGALTGTSLPTLSDFTGLLQSTLSIGAELLATFVLGIGALVEGVRRGIDVVAVSFAVLVDQIPGLEGEDVLGERFTTLENRAILGEQRQAAIDPIRDAIEGTRGQISANRREQARILQNIEANRAANAEGAFLAQPFAREVFAQFGQGLSREELQGIADQSVFETEGVRRGQFLSGPAFAIVDSVVDDVLEAEQRFNELNEQTSNLEQTLGQLNSELRNNLRRLGEEDIPTSILGAALEESGSQYGFTDPNTRLNVTGLSFTEQFRQFRAARQRELRFQTLDPQLADRLGPGVTAQQTAAQTVRNQQAQEAQQEAVQLRQSMETLNNTLEQTDPSRNAELQVSALGRNSDVLQRLNDRIEDLVNEVTERQGERAPLVRRIQRQGRSAQENADNPGFFERSPVTVQRNRITAEASLFPNATDEELRNIGRSVAAGIIEGLRAEGDTNERRFSMLLDTAQENVDDIIEQRQGLRGLNLEINELQEEIQRLRGALDTLNEATVHQSSLLESNNEELRIMSAGLAAVFAQGSGAFGGAQNAGFIGVADGGMFFGEAPANDNVLRPDNDNQEVTPFTTLRLDSPTAAGTAGAGTSRTTARALRNPAADALASFNRSLADQEAALGVSRRQLVIEREITQLKRAGVVLSAEEEAFARNRLSSLLQFADLLDRVRQTSDEVANLLGETLFQEIREGGFQLSELGNSLADIFTRSFTDYVSSELSDFFDSLISAASGAVAGGGDATGLAGTLNALFGLADVGSSVTGSFATAVVPGSNLGGSFTIQGRPGNDNNIVSLNGTPVTRASRGEQLGIAAASNRGSGNTNNISVPVSITINGGSEAQLQRLEGIGEQIAGQIEARINNNERLNPRRRAA